MNVCVELRAANGDEYVIKSDLQDNIDTLNKFIDKASGLDRTKLMDTCSILVGLQQNLPSE